MKNAFKFIFAIALIAYCFHLRLTDGEAGFWVFPAIVAMFWVLINFNYLFIDDKYKGGKRKKK